MSDTRYNTPDLETESDATIEANYNKILIEYYDEDSTDNIKNKKAYLNNLNGLVPFSNGIRLSSGRTAFQEKVSEIIPNTDGWYTIAECSNSIKIAGADFFCEFVNFSITCKVNVINDTLTKTHETTTIKKTSTSGVYVTGNGAKEFRLAKSDSVAAGFKLQVYINVTVAANVMNTAIDKNHANLSTAGWQLVTPYLDNTPTLPDGVTTGTFLVAGEEYSLDHNTHPSLIICQKFSDTYLLLTIDWDELPYNGSSIALTFPSIRIDLTDGTGTTITLPPTNYTLSISKIIRHRVYFAYTATSGTPFAALNAGLLTFKPVGTGAKLKLS